jgi:PAS domain S-box-containing protein
VATVIALPLAVALALRFDRVGAAVAGMVATLGVVIGAVAGEGPFSRELVAEALPAIFGLWALTLALQTVALLLGVAVAANRRQTAEIEAVNARLRQVVDAARLGYWQFDADWRTTHANPRLAAMLGSNVAGLLGRSILDLVPDRAGPEARQRLDAALRGEHEGDVELEFTRGDGGTSWLSLHVTPLLAPRSLRTRRGLGGGAIAAVEDIGERRRGEAQRLRLETNILHAQKLESLGVLASGLAHDFNNIVMSIRGNAELLRRGRGGEPPVEWVRSGAERIDQACDRAAALVATLMAYAGKGEFVVERVGISRAIREAVEVARLAAPRNAVLVFEPPAAELAVDADPQYLRQLLVSILSNAVEALRSEGGTVRVGWQATAPHGASVPESIEIAVSDDGVGMGRELQARAFEPFFTTKGLGRGLGLSSALGIAHRLGGSIEIESASGLGTTVRVRLPVASPDPIESAAPGRSAEVAARRPVALLVEPLPAARDLAIVALELRGFSVAEERDLDAAIREARRRPVGLLVADVGASILVAVDALRAARNDGFDVPIVLSSERRDTEVLMPGDDRTLWIPRPFGVRELLDAVDSLQRPTRREREARAALATWTSMAGL